MHKSHAWIAAWEKSLLIIISSSENLPWLAGFACADVTDRETIDLLLINFDLVSDLLCLVFKTFGIHWCY